MISRRVPFRAWVRRGVRGVTFLELVIALGLLALALGSIFGFVVTGGGAARTTNSFLQSQAQLRAALDSVVDETRWAQAVSAAGAASVTLLIPEDTPFSVGPYAVTFAYNAAADTVTRQVDPDAGGPALPGAAEPLAFDVVQENGGAGLAFEYFDGNNISLGSTPAAADLPSISRLRLSVTTTREKTSRTFTGDVALRGQ